MNKEEAIARNICKAFGSRYAVTETYEGGFELSFDGEAYAGGSYNIGYNAKGEKAEGQIWLASAGDQNQIVATYTDTEIKLI